MSRGQLVVKNNMLTAIYRPPTDFSVETVYAQLETWEQEGIRTSMAVVIGDIALTDTALATVETLAEHPYTGVASWQTGDRGVQPDFNRLSQPQYDLSIAVSTALRATTSLHQAENGLTHAYGFMNAGMYKPDGKSEQITADNHLDLPCKDPDPSRPEKVRFRYVFTVGAAGPTNHVIAELREDQIQSDGEIVFNDGDQFDIVNFGTGKIVCFVNLFGGHSSPTTPGARLFVTDSSSDIVSVPRMV